MKLTPRQRDLLNLIRDGGAICCYTAPGREHLPVGCYLEKKGDHRDLDGRTVNALEKRGLIEWDDCVYIISDAGKLALAS